MLCSWTLEKPLILSLIQNYSLNCGPMASLVLYGPGSKRTYPIAHMFVDGCSGVPQGSVLGPLLFLIYVNDIPNVTTFCRPYLFADDTKLLETIYHHTSSKHLQEDLDSLATWCSNWKLSLNCSKCAALQFTLSSSTPTTYLIDGPGADPDFRVRGC